MCCNCDILICDCNILVCNFDTHVTILSRHTVVCRVAQENGGARKCSEYIDRNNKVAIFTQL